LIQQVGYDTGSEDDAAMGFPVFGSAKFNVTDTASIQGNANYTDGTNGYLWRSGTNYYGEDAYVDPNGNVETIAGMVPILTPASKLAPEHSTSFMVLPLWIGTTLWMMVWPLGKTRNKYQCLS